MRDVIQKDTTLQQQWGIFLRLGTTGCCDLKTVRSLFLEDRITLSNLPGVLWLWCKLFATEDDTLKQEDVIFTVDVGLGHDENVFEQEFTKIGDMMSLPVLDPALEVSDGLHIFSSALSFIDLIRDTFGGRASFLELVVVWIVGR